MLTPWCVSSWLMLCNAACPYSLDGRLKVLIDSDLWQPSPPSPSPSTLLLKPALSFQQPIYECHDACACNANNKQRCKLRLIQYGVHIAGLQV
jgi:hypothetical protein